MPQMVMLMINRYLMKICKCMTMITLLVLLTGCYGRGERTPDAWNLTDNQIDSISFYTTHHYTQGFNFVVTADSLLLTELPYEECGDSMVVYEGSRIVVADIKTLPQDSIDSIWVKVAHDQFIQGWVREGQLLENVYPDDPISQFITTFSDTHLLLFLALIVIVVVSYLLFKLKKKNAYIVHFNDINSIYPTILTLLVSSSATFYASIQMFRVEEWRHFYYHPSLNPFSLPIHLALFISSVWMMVIVSIAVVDDIRHKLTFSESILYLLGLLGVCAVDYVVFSISTLYYIGYPLLVAYFVYALFRYKKTSFARYVCGRCGLPIKEKGKCPHCGSVNI